ncbi:protein TonB [Novosphingobium gossypii]
MFCLPLVLLALLSWRTVVAHAPVAPHVAAFDVTDPAPVKDEPVPEEVEPESEPQPVAVAQPTAVIPPPAVITQHGRAHPVPDTPAQVAPVPVAAPPAPPVTKPRTSGGQQGPDTWHARVLARLNAVKTYPGSARARRQQGTVMVRFTVDRKGQVLGVALHRTSGFALLDREALALPKRASPLPAPPDDVPSNSIELIVPVEFYL